MKKSKKNYFDKKLFTEELKRYNMKRIEAEKAGKPPPQISNAIGKGIWDIAEHTARRPNFNGYSYKDEMILDGVENGLKAIKNFDPEKSENPFGYLTITIWRAFLRRIESEQKQLYIKNKVTEDVMVNQDRFGEITENDVTNDIMSSFVSDFEEKIERRKRETKERKIKNEQKQGSNT